MKRSEYRPEHYSTQALADLHRLMRNHSMNIEVVNCLLTSKAEAGRYISYFRRMTFIINSSFMAGGLASIGFGAKRLSGGEFILGGLCLIIGMVIFWKFSAAFVSMTRTLQATVAVARKHDLI